MRDYGFEGKRWYHGEGVVWITANWDRGVFKWGIYNIGEEKAGEKGVGNSTAEKR